MSLRCAGALLGKGDVNDLLKLAPSLDEEVVLIDADVVCGVDHIGSAVIHARRAFERKSNAANTLGMEVILYASGERQISKAKKKMGLHQGTKHVAVVVLSPEDADVDDVLRKLGLDRDDRLLECTPEKCNAFGLGGPEIAAIGAVRMQELVLEKVAFVEMLKR